MQSREVAPQPRVLAMFPFYNEADKLEGLAKQIRPGLVEEFLGVDDGSTDGGAEILRRHGIRVVSQAHRGLGACIKTAVRYAQEQGFHVMVVMAGNGKDKPEEIPRLLEPILAGTADYVQGSRFLPGGTSPNLPRFRKVAIRTLSLLFTLVTGKRCTDLTNGFRAWRLSILEDPRINIWQDWLDTYELEYYLHWKVYTLGYRVVEVPVSKVYPVERNVPYTKIKPIVGWWRMLRPFFFLALGIKK